MNYLREWPVQSQAAGLVSGLLLTRKFHEFTPWRDCDHGYGRPSWRPRVSAPATYRSGTPRNQHPAVARWHAHLHGLATAIHEISGLANQQFSPLQALSISPFYPFPVKPLLGNFYPFAVKPLLGNSVALPMFEGYYLSGLCGFS